MLVLWQVWVNAEIDGNGRVHFAADSDSELTRGLAAVLVEALSGLTPEEVLQVRCAMAPSHVWHGRQPCHDAGLLERVHLIVVIMWRAASEAQKARLSLQS